MYVTLSTINFFKLKFIHFTNKHADSDLGYNHYCSNIFNPTFKKMDKKTYIHRHLISPSFFYLLNF
jgi:hypothetical protein